MLQSDKQAEVGARKVMEKWKNTRQGNKRVMLNKADQMKGRKTFTILRFLAEDKAGSSWTRLTIVRL